MIYVFKLYEWLNLILRMIVLIFDKCEHLFRQFHELRILSDVSRIALAIILLYTLRDFLLGSTEGVASEDTLVLVVLSLTSFRLILF